MGWVINIAGYVTGQLSQYTYTFPHAPRVSSKYPSEISLMLCEAIGNGLVMCSKPYQNDQIISVIQELYFTEGPGGTASFASHFKHLFPTYKGLDGVVSYEVPVPCCAGSY